MEETSKITIPTIENKIIVSVKIEPVDAEEYNSKDAHPFTISYKFDGDDGGFDITCGLKAGRTTPEDLEEDLCRASKEAFKDVMHCGIESKKEETPQERRVTILLMVKYMELVNEFTELNNKHSKLAEEFMGLTGKHSILDQEFQNLKVENEKLKEVLEGIE